ncbi:MAG TPA: bifunctional serine/threonine-protein kinase/formylglycine-generating enzyme family protein, partial [Anaerolineaceae bacterium]|nr:bifunctional serine/threonine-protein kinase/formylglycine-generating enzyme family protein [Anaerolineaceae bacterium]
MTQLGKYELHEVIGRGGFGTVYRAIDASLGREVALKILHPQLTTDPDFLERFRNEARLVASLKSPYIITIYELGEEDGRVFIAMDYLPGGSLKQKLEKEGAITFDKTLKIIKQVCSGLEEAHEQGLVHRDVKPANILFDRKGNAVIGDFGLARAIQLSSTSAASSTGGVGTPAYRAPELWIGKPPASMATDIYSLGCVFSEMLTGKVLFEGDTTDQILARHLNLGPSPPEIYPAGVPPRIRSVIERAVNKEVTERYPSVADFEQALDEAVADDQKPPEIPWTKPLPVEVPVIPDKPEDSLGVSKPQPVSTRKSKTGVWLAVGGGLALILLIIFCILGGWISSMINGAPSVGTEAYAATPAPTKTPVLGVGSTMVSQVDGMTLVYVPAGEFTMGSPDGVGISDEHPQHQVYLDAYWIDQTEVTNAMYEECVNDGDCTEPSSYSSYTRDSYYGNTQYADYPVIYVNWNQAQDYCEWAGRELPTEAQWEKAARGTDGRIYPWGDGSPDESLANFAGIIGDTTEVGSYPDGASPYGALDIAGNVWEWVLDRYGEAYYSDSLTSNPVGPSIGITRVLRGGSV